MLTNPVRTKFTLLLLLVLALSATLPAQEFRGRISGAVVDATGGAVPGATVTLLNAQTAVAVTRQSNDAGQYIFDLISPGNYSVTVEMKGITRFLQENIILQQRGDLTINVVLRPGDIKETVTVSAEASMVQFSNAKLDTTVDSMIVNNMPQIYRSPFLLAQLDPAVEKNDAGNEFQPYHSLGAAKALRRSGAFIVPPRRPWRPLAERPWQPLSKSRSTVESDGQRNHRWF